MIGGGDWFAGDRDTKEVYNAMSQEFAGGGARLHDDGRPDTTHTLGQAPLEGGVRRAEPGDAVWAGRADLASCLNSHSVRALRTWLQGKAPALSARLDKLIEAELGPTYSDPGSSVTTTVGYARAEDQPEVYARSVAGEVVRLPPAMANRR
jgi:hypothetical protein